MARVIKEHQERRQEFLNTARELFYSEGYEQTSVNNILDKMGLSKGTFYHYFKSKEELLDALVEQMVEQIIALIRTIVDDPSIDAITKLNTIFEHSAAYKASNRDLIMTLLRSLYRDENILLRKKMYERALNQGSPLITRVIKQGLAEGVFDTPFPDEISQIFYALLEYIGTRSADLMLGMDEHPENLEALYKVFDLYEHSFERLLGAPRGSIRFSSRETLKELFG